MPLILKDASIQEWEKAYSADCNATYSQGVAWNSLWGKFRGYELAPKLVYSDGQLLGVLPLLVYKKWYESQYMSGFNGYGGLLASPEVMLDTPEQLIPRICASMKSVNLLENPFSRYREATGDFLPADPPRKVDIQYLDLRAGFDAQFRKWSKGHSSAAKKGIRDGVVVRKAETLEDWRAYYNVYLDSIRRWGKQTTSRYPWELFQAMFDMNDDRIVLWLASLGAEVISGSLCFYGHRHIAYWHGAALESHFDCKAPHVLQYRIAEDAAAKGFYWYDMLSSGNHPGVEKFKKGFAAETLSPMQFRTRPFVFSTLHKMRASLNRLKS